MNEAGIVMMIGVRLFKGNRYRIPGMHIDMVKCIKHAGPRSGGCEAVATGNGLNLFESLMDVVSVKGYYYRIEFNRLRSFIDLIQFISKTAASSELFDKKAYVIVI